MSVPDTASPALAPPLARPTRYRYGVLTFACVLSMVTYLDRVCIGTVMPDMQREFGFDDAQRGWIFFAFTIAYAALEVPSGWLGDRFGPRKTLVRIVLWWSVFTALTGAIYPSDSVLHLGSMAFSVSYLAMLAVRFCFGMGEAGAYPNIARAFHNWFPFGERGFAKGAVWMAGRFAGGVTGFIVLAMLITRPAAEPGAPPVVYWRHTFWIFGILGLVWCAFFWAWFRDRPDQKAGVNTAEIALIHANEPQHPEAKLRVPWRQLLTSGNLWLLCLMYFCASYGWYFNITYLQGFLGEQFGLSSGEKWTARWWSFSAMQGMPLLFGSVACLLGGILTDRFIRRTGNRRWGRRLFGILGHGMCAVFCFVALGLLQGTPDRAERGLGLAWLFVLSIGFAAFWNDMTMGSAWASCLDIGGRYSGIVAGCMNTVGNLGGSCANVVTGQILYAYTAGIDKQADPQAYYLASQPAWVINFAIFGLVYVLAVVLWLRFDATVPVAASAVAAAEPVVEVPPAIAEDDAPPA